MRILLVEDEIDMASWLLRALKQSGFVADHAATAQEAETFIAVTDYDIVVLDLRLPDRHGFELLATLRDRGCATPVLILTAQGSLHDRVQGLNLGADDFLTKPFAVEELEARMASIVRRSVGRQTGRLQCASLFYDDASRAFNLKGDWLALTPREHAALLTLLMRSGSPVAKSQLSGKVFPHDREVGPDAIELVLHRVRRKLEGSDVRIVTVRGLGYMMERAPRASTRGELGDDGRYHRQLLGDAALPGPPQPAALQPVFYNAQFQDRPVRIAAIERRMHAAGTDYHVLVLAAESTGAREQALQVVWQQTVLRDVWQLGIVILLVWLSVGWTLKPLNRLRDGLRQRGGQPLTTPLEAQSVPNEVRPLVDVINQHIWARQEAVEAQARFLADASHQLRMPLAIMFAQARYALREHDPVRTRETLEAILGQLDHSRRLAEQLLSLAHATQAAPGEGARRVDLNAIARDVVLQYLSMAHGKNIDLGWQDARGEEVADQSADPSVDGAGDAAAPVALVVPVLASDVEIREILANLVHNAIRYTPAGGHITLAVHAAAGHAPGLPAPGEGRWARAEVIDSGPGIAPERRESAFARFQREAAAEVADAATARGAGLGLSIARAYAQRNGGEVVLADAQPEARARGQAPGLRAVLWLPAAT
ncbi:MAG: Transcriptional regulatory protein tctD [Paracidovorax wautersii]|uniref:histidine kinase n=1 Tax=Paracidovorax wautersii TaxID=1177982 RepID=A0A7V8JRQ7_9BURK|nr:MAG: Transcriptional regulatory protein tctD [Paracidovorax wautersii]